MVKKIGSAGMLVGGLLAAIGGLVSMLNFASLNINAAMGMAVMGRVGAIIVFIAAIVVLAGVFMAGETRKGGAIAGLVFAVFAFGAQFMINPITSWKAAFTAGFSGNAEAAGGAAVIGLILLAVSGLVCAIMGIVGLVSKKRA